VGEEPARALDVTCHGHPHLATGAADCDLAALGCDREAPLDGGRLVVATGQGSRTWAAPTASSQTSPIETATSSGNTIASSAVAAPRALLTRGTWARW
jgi:hypothetical protein